MIPGEPTPIEALREPTPGELALADEQATALEASLIDAASRLIMARISPEAASRPATVTVLPSRNGILSAQEAAGRLDYLKPDGRVRDSFYARVAPRLGFREDSGPWRFDAEKVEQ